MSTYSATQKLLPSNESQFYVYRNVLLACLGSLLLGYDTGIMSAAILYMDNDLNLTTMQKETIIASLNFFSAFGGLIFGQIARVFGRRFTIACASIIFFIGALLMASTKIFYIIVFSRILLGIAVGAGLMVTPLYIAEISPAHIRGQLLTFDEIGIDLGILLGYIIGWLFFYTSYSDSNKWRIMVGLGTIPATMLFIAMLFMPESPRWLIQNNKNMKAKQILNKIYNYQKNIVNTKFKEIKETLELEQQLDKNISWKVILCSCIYSKEKYISWSLFIGVTLCFFQQASGNEAAVYYTPTIFQQIGLNEQNVLLMTTLVGLSKLLFLLVPMLLLDKVGRKKLLLVSSVLMTVCLLGLGISFVPNIWSDNNRPIGLAIFLQCFFMASFSMAWGAVCWIVAAEIFPLKIRARGLALCVFVNRIVSATIAFTFLSTQEAITAYGTFFLYGSISLISIFFIMFFVPETKGKTLEEITKFLISSHTSNKQLSGIEMKK
eukprot:298523_1